MIKILAPAKLNLSLDIVGRRDDGYHLLQTVMKTISLFDMIGLEKSDNISIRCNWEDVPTDSKNLCYKAAELFFKTTGISGGAAIRLEKQIPFGAGLGGGSSDAAATLKGLDKLYKTNMSPNELAACGIKIGADVPFFFYGKTALVEGIGEKYTLLDDFIDCWFVVVKPKLFISAAQAYIAFDRLKNTKHPNTDIIVDAINQRDLNLFCQNAGNVLEEAVDKPEVWYIKNRLNELGAKYSAMTGSGSAVFGIFASKELADSAALHFEKEDMEAFVCK